MTDLIMNRQGFMKMGKYRNKEERADKGKKLSHQIDDLLKADLIDYLRKNNPNGLEILMAYLAYESSTPNIDSCADERAFMIKSARKEGVRFIYEHLEKLGKEKKDEHTDNRSNTSNNRGN